MTGDQGIPPAVPCTAHIGVEDWNSGFSHQTCPADHVYSLGCRKILNYRKVGVICSVRCPGEIILQTYELMKAVRNSGITIISGFHSPMEQECLNILLRGTCGVVICPARSLPKRLEPEYQKPIEDNRMLMLSAFGEKHNRPTAQTGVIRNRFVADIADLLFVPYAAPGGKTEAMCREIVNGGKPFYTFAGDHTSNLSAIGVRQLSLEEAASVLMG